MVGNLSFVALVTWVSFAIWFDCKERRLPDGLVLIGALMGVLFAIAQGTTVGKSVPTSLLWSVGGAMLGIITGFSCAVPGLFLTGTPTLGGGDIKLLAALGTWFGPLAVPVILLISLPLVVAHLFIIWIRSRGTTSRITAPYGVALGLAAILWEMLGREAAVADLIRNLIVQA